MVLNRRVVLHSRPQYSPSLDTFRIVDGEVCMILLKFSLFFLLHLYGCITVGRFRRKKFKRGRNISKKLQFFYRPLPKGLLWIAW